MKAYLRDDIKAELLDGKVVYTVSFSFAKISTAQLADILEKAEHIGELEVSYGKSK